MSRAPRRSEAMALPPRENPFRTERLDRLAYRSPATGEPADPAPLADRFDQLGRRAAIVGPEGSGKTTLLDALVAELGDRGLELQRWRAAPGGGGLVRERTGESGRSPAADLHTGGTSTLLVVDGLDRLGRRDRRRLRRAARSAAGLLATSHRRLRLPTLLRCTTTPALLEALIAELTADASIEPRSLPSAEALHARHRGNVRTALLELYDLQAGRGGVPASPGGGTP